ncbi:MAG TPA: hypothetical protein VM619_00440 [Luteimonas sp.]|nr:hypothetical protein [Luteimonas sp.]
MISPRRFLFLLPVVALVVFEAAFVWHPFEVRTTLYQTAWRGNKPVGELVDGFQVRQVVPAGLVRTRPSGRKSVHWRGPHSLRATLRPNCFSIRFATYKRTNGGRIETTWQQGDVAQSWQVAAAGLADNEFVDFCPEGGIDTDRPAMVGIRGIGGRSGSAATAWLTRSKLEPATVQGKQTGNRSLALQLAYLRRAHPGDIALLGGGAFLLACLCSLGIGLLAFIAVRRDLARTDVS